MRLSNRFDNNRLHVCIGLHDTTGYDNRLYRVYKHSTGCQTRLSTGLTTGCIVYTAGCQTGCITRSDNRLNEQWLFVQQFVQPVVKPGLTTG